MLASTVPRSEQKLLYSTFQHTGTLDLVDLKLMSCLCTTGSLYDFVFRRCTRFVVLNSRLTAPPMQAMYMFMTDRRLNFDHD
jgi:hypothetical protein